MAARQKLSLKNYLKNSWRCTRGVKSDGGQIGVNTPVLPSPPPTKNCKAMLDPREARVFLSGDRDSVVPHVLLHDPVTITPILHVPDCSGRAVGASQLSR